MREHPILEGSQGGPDAQALLGWSLPRHPKEVPSLEWLVRRVRDSRLDWRLLEALIRFDSAGYARRTLARTEACELLLVCWLPGQASLVHDHGGSSGVSLLLRGRLLETRYAWGGDRLLPATFTRAGEGDLLLERPETVHRIQNVSGQGAVSLHLYAPPMRGMTRYDASVLPAPGEENLRPRPPPLAGGAPAPGRRRRPPAT